MQTQTLTKPNSRPSIICFSTRSSSSSGSSSHCDNVPVEEEAMGP